VGKEGTGEWSEFKPVAVGIGIWVVLFVLAVVFRHDLQTDGHSWWVWTALAGIVEGLFGYLYLLRRRARMDARAAAEVTGREYRTPGRP
jgi:O-antigen/teichoic acid export membrane protein